MTRLKIKGRELIYAKQPCVSERYEPGKERFYRHFGRWPFADDIYGSFTEDGITGALEKIGLI